MSLPFPFFSKKAEGKAVADGEPIRSAGRECRRKFALVSERLQLRNRSSCLFKRKQRRGPRRCVKSPAGFVDWTDQPYSDPRLSPRACLTRQAGFTAARPAANWIPGLASAWKRPTHNLEVSGQPCVVRRVVEDIRRDADCGLEDWSGGFQRCAARKIGQARRGSDREEGRAAEALRHWARMPV